MSTDKPILLTIGVYPPNKKNERRIIISGAPDGEMPVLLTGLFPERHALLDRAYAQILKRDPQLVTLKEEKAEKTSKSKSKGASSDDDDDEPGDDGETVEASDQLVSDNPLPASPVDTGEEQETAQLSDISEPAADLPVIEGEPYYKQFAKRIAYGTFEKLKAEQSEVTDEVGNGEQD